MAHRRSSSYSSRSRAALSSDTPRSPGEAVGAADGRSRGGPPRSHRSSDASSWLHDAGGLPTSQNRQPSPQSSYSTRSAQLMAAPSSSSSSSSAAAATAQSVLAPPLSKKQQRRSRRSTDPGNLVGYGGGGGGGHDVTAASVAAATAELVASMDHVRQRVSRVEAGLVDARDLHGAQLKVVTDRAACLRAAVRSDIAALGQETHAALEDALQTVDAKLLATKAELAEVERRAAQAVDGKLERLQELFEQTLADYEAQLLEDFQQLFWKIQQDTFVEVDARIERAMKLFDQDHSKQVGFAFDRMDFKIKGMHATAIAGSKSEGAGGKCVNYVTSMFIVGFMTLVELLTYLSMPFSALARCCREGRCPCSSNNGRHPGGGGGGGGVASLKTAATVQMAASKFRHGTRAARGTNSGNGGGGGGGGGAGAGGALLRAASARQPFAGQPATLASVTASTKARR